MEQFTAKKKIKNRRRQFAEDAAKQLKEEGSPTLQHAMDMANEKGVSSWLTVLSPKEHAPFYPTQASFRDALSLGYGRLPSMVSMRCSCGHSFLHPTLAVVPKGWLSLHMAQ